jgi:hypothetical protein
VDDETWVAQEIERLRRAPHHPEHQLEDPDVRARYRATIKARIDWEPEEPNYHLFAVDVESAGFVVFGKDRFGLAWDPERGLRRWDQRTS